jgi:hypothetical protein
MIWTRRAARAFSSEVEAGSRQENASNQESSRLLSASSIKFRRHYQPREIDMAKGEQKGNRETKKPKKEKIKVIAAAPSQKTAGWQPTFGSGKKK